MSSSNCCFMTCIQVSQEAGQVVWYSCLFQNFPQFIVIHTVKGFGIVNKAEVDAFLELSCFFDDPVDVGNLIFDFSAFSKTSLNIWKFTVHILSKPGLENFQFSHSVVSDSAIPWIAARQAPLSITTPGVYSNSCPLSWWCHPAISSSVIPFFSCPQSLPASGSFPTSQLFTWGGQSIGVSVSESVLPMNTQNLSPSGWTGWISLQSKGLSRVFSNTIVQSINFSALSFLHSPTLTPIHDHWKNHSLD